MMKRQYPNFFGCMLAAAGAAAWLGVLNPTSAAADALPSGTAWFTPMTYTDPTTGASTNYQLYIPYDYDPSRKYPVIYVLNGGGEDGTDNRKQVNNVYVETILNHVFDPSGKYEAFILAPQTTDFWFYTDANGYGYWGGNPPQYPNRPIMQYGLNILDGLPSRYSIDTNREYITGISNGAVGTWDQIVRDPGRWAAAVPVSGEGPDGYEPVLKNLPIWDFIGAQDNIFSVPWNQQEINAINAVGGNARLTVFPNFGHDDNTFAGAYNYVDPTTGLSLFDWMYAQSRPVPEPAALALFVGGLLPFRRSRRRRTI